MRSDSPVERASARHRRRAVAAPAAKPASTTPVVPAKHSTVTKPSPTTNARTAVSDASIPAPIINLPPSQTATNSASSTPSQSTTPRTTAASSSPKPKSSSASTKPKGSSSTKASSTQSAAPALSSAKDASSSTPKIVGVVVGIVAVLAIVALGIVLRKWLIRRRKNKMNTWGADLQSNLERKRETYHDDVLVTSASVVVTPPFTDKPLAPLPSDAITLPVMPAAAGVPEQLARPPSWSSAAPSSIAPSTYTTVPMAPQSPSLAGMNSVVAVDPSTPSAAVRRELCVVKRTFLPTMPDELSLTNGEHVFIVQAYDDGWAKCVNLRGSQGVVPIECLARNVDADAQHAGGDTQDGASWRLSKRASSLFAPANAPGMY